MMERPAVFWGSAVLAAMVFAALVPLLMPFETLRLMSPEDQRRGWLLTVFCGGVLAALFGLSAAISGPRLINIGIRDVAEAGSVMKALETARKTKKIDDPSRMNFATWVVAMGVALIGCYFVLWLTLPVPA